MANYSINAVTRRVVYSGSAGAGPYAFAFEVLEANDLAVYKNTTLLTLTTDYTVSIGAAGTGSITLVSAATGSDTITITGARDIERTTDFVTAGDLKAAALNEQLDSQIIMIQQVSEANDRAIKAPVTDPTSIDMTLPAKDTRKGKYLAFNSTTGNPEAGASSDDVATLASITDDIGTLADIEDGTDATDAIQTVAGISGNVSTVAGISGNVTTVATNNSNVTAVAGNAANINTVAGISGNVTTVAGISSDVTAVAGDATDIGTVATDLSGSNTIGTVAGIAADVTTVAGISGDVSSVAAQVVGYAFSTTTTMADPGSGNVRFNNATVSSVTAIAIDDLDSNGVDQSAYVALWDDSTNTVKGTLVFRTSGGDIATFNITGLTDNTGWFQIAVTHVASSGTFSAAEDCYIGFTRAGDKGADGAGVGDVIGPASSTDNALARYDGTTGKLLQNSTVVITDAGNVGIGTLLPDGKIDIATGGTTDVVAALGGTFPAFTYRNGTGSWFHAGKHPSSDYFYIGHGGTPTTNVDVVVDSSGRLITGNNASISVLSVEAGFQNYSGAGYMTAGKFGADAFAPFYTFVKSRNATVGAHTIVQNGDDLGTIAFTGSDGTGFIRGAQIRAQVDGTPGTNDMPGRLTFFTTADGASSPSERMRITSAGNVEVNGTITATTFGTSSQNAYGARTVSTSSPTGGSDGDIWYKY
jgi:hypothetical protein